METNSSYQQIQHQSPHKSIIYEQPTLSNNYIQVHLEKSQPHSQHMNLRRTTKHNYNEDSGSHTTVHNLNKHKHKEEDKSWSDESTNNSVEKTNKNKQENKTYSPTDQYNLKISKYLNHLQCQQEVTIHKSKWQHKNPINSRLVNYTTNLRVTPPSSITTNSSFPLNLCPDPTQTRQQIDHKIVNNPSQNFFNIEELTGLNIVPPSKLPNRIIKPTVPNTKKQLNNNNQYNCKSKNPNNKEWETPKKSQIRTTTTLTKMVQTKLINKTDKDLNLSFGDIPSKKNPNITRILFINTNGLDLGTDSHSLNELCSNSKSQQYNILLLAETNTHWKN